MDAGSGATREPHTFSQSTPKSFASRGTPLNLISTISELFNVCLVFVYLDVPK